MLVFTHWTISSATLLAKALHGGLPSPSMRHLFLAGSPTRSPLPQPTSLSSLLPTLSIDFSYWSYLFKLSWCFNIYLDLSHLFLDGIGKCIFTSVTKIPVWTISTHQALPTGTFPSLPQSIFCFQRQLLFGFLIRMIWFFFPSLEFHRNVRASLPPLVRPAWCSRLWDAATLLCVPQVLSVLLLSASAASSGPTMVNKITVNTFVQDFLKMLFLLSGRHIPRSWCLCSCACLWLPLVLQPDFSSSENVSSPEASDIFPTPHLSKLFPFFRVWLRCHFIARKESLGKPSPVCWRQAAPFIDYSYACLHSLVEAGLHHL